MSQLCTSESYACFAPAYCTENIKVYISAGLNETQYALWNMPNACSVAQARHDCYSSCSSSVLNVQIKLYKMIIRQEILLGCVGSQTASVA